MSSMRHEMKPYTALKIVCLTALLIPNIVPVRSVSADAEKDPEQVWTLDKLFERTAIFVVPPREVRLGPDKYGREWTFSGDKQGNFTFFDGVKDVHTTDDNALAFRLTGKTATLGWGNYAGKQPRQDRVRLWPAFTLALNVKQATDAETTFDLRFWQDGQRDDRTLGEALLDGTDWTTLTFNVSPRLPLRDGFELEISGAPGTELQIRHIEITRKLHEASFRKEFVLPDSEVWRAVAEIGAQTHFYVNGHEVGSREKPYFGRQQYQNETVEFGDYLKPGRTNCVAVYGRRYNYSPYLCAQGSAIMSSGERIPVDTDNTWEWSFDAPDGWKLPGFDADGWRTVGEQAEEQKNVKLSGRRMFTYKGKKARPVHDGYIRLGNPDDDTLFYTDDRDMRFYAYVPNGLKERELRLAWRVSKFEDGAFEDVARGSTGEYVYRGRSLRFTVNAGRLARGVYVLKATLMDGEKILDDRIPEPVVVTGRLPMEWTDGENYTQGMDLELERDIDLTDPEDGPWTEAAGGDKAPEPSTDPDAGIQAPGVVNRNGLTYRESRPHYGAVISYLVTFQHPGDFYLMELDYPNDMERHMGVACCPWNWGATRGHSKSSAAVTTGDRYPVTGDMQTLRWIYRPDPGPHAINLANLSRNEHRAAGAELRIYHIQNGLPALKASTGHTRWNGLITERTRGRNARFGIYDTPRPEGKAAKEAIKGRDDSEPVKEICADLAYYLDACEAFARYMRFVGQNVHIMGAFQYSPNNDPGFEPPWSFPCARIQAKASVRDVLARVLRDNHIDIYAHIEFVHCPALLQLAAERPDRPDTGFWDTPYLVNRDGEEYTEWEGRYGFNFNHPEVRAVLLNVGADVVGKYRTLSNFKGIVWDPYFGSDWLPTYRGRLRRGPLEPDEFTALGYGDVMIREFEIDTGWTLPFSLDDPDRFRKRHDYLNAGRMRDIWLAWRAEKMKGFFRDLADEVHKQRQDLKCVANCYMNPIHFLEWRRSGMSFHDYMLANGWDGQRFAEDDAVCLAPTPDGKMNHHPRVRSHGLGWDMSGSPEVFEFFDAPDMRAVQIKHNWHELEQRAWNLPPRDKWPRPFQMTLMQQPDGDNAREVFVRMLIGLDPNLFYYGFSDATLFEGNEQPVREFNKVLRALPTEKFMPVDGTGLASNLAVRELRRDFDYWVYAANPGYWPVNGEIVLEQAGAVLNAVNDAPAATAGRGGKTKVHVALAPFGVAAFKVDSPDARIVEWAAEAEPGKGTDHLEDIVAQTARLLENPGARVVLRPEDEAFMREAVASAREAIAAGRYAKALSETSSDRFWVLKTEYMEKGAEYATETERSAQTTTEKKRAMAQRTDRPPAVDGELDDALWQEAETYGGFICADKMPAMATTTFQVVHDRDAVYFAVRCKDRRPDEVKADAEHEKHVFRDDCVALFIQPDADRVVYCQMAFSANGVKFDQEVKGGSKNYAFAPPWDVATKRTDEGWVAEIKLPAASIDADVESGEAWRFNIHRAFRERKTPPSSWSYTPASWHDIKRLGTLTFE